MLDRYEIKWKWTLRGKKMHNSNHFRVENYMVWKIRRQEQFSLTIPPALGWHEAFPVPRRPGSSWGTMTAANGLLCQLLLVILGPSYTPDQQPGLSPVEVGMAPSHWKFPKPHWNHFSNHATGPAAWFWPGASPRGSRNQTMHSQEALRLNCTGWGLKDSLF